MIGTKYPYGTAVKIQNDRYRTKTFRFLNLFQGQSVLYFAGRTEKASFYLLVDPRKVYSCKNKKQIQFFVSEKAETVHLENNEPRVHKHSFPSGEEFEDDQVCQGCGRVFKKII